MYIFANILSNLIISLDNEKLFGLNYSFGLKNIKQNMRQLKQLLQRFTSHQK